MCIRDRLKFNQIVYLRNQHSAKYFAGFPIGFNIAIGGIDENGCDIYNELSLLLLKAQYHLGLPQPNLSVRLNKNSSHELIPVSYTHLRLCLIICCTQYQVNKSWLV